MKESNILLANFLGWKKENFYLNLKTGSLVKKENNDCDLQPTTHYLRNNKPVTTLYFHNDWNWLMEVVEKIESLGFEFFIVESRCRIAHNTDKSIETIIDFEILGTKIEAVYNACVEFVEWWNKNN